jgi:hypothetical protein
MVPGLVESTLPGYMDDIFATDYVRNANKTAWETYELWHSSSLELNDDL